MRVYMIVKHTGKHRHSNIISIGLMTNMLSDERESFYAESVEYQGLDFEPISCLVRKTILDRLTLHDMKENSSEVENRITKVKGTEMYIEEKLRSWLFLQSPFKNSIEIWGDDISYQWTLFCNLFGGENCIPECVKKPPMDTATLIASLGIDPNIDRMYLSYIHLSNEKDRCYKELVRILDIIFPDTSSAELCNLEILTEALLIKSLRENGSLLNLSLRTREFEMKKHDFLASNTYLELLIEQFKTKKPD